MNEAVFDDTPYIETGHNSLPKHLADAELARQLSPYAVLVTQMAATALSSFGYKSFTQERVGKDGVLFSMPKLQTMASVNEPPGPANKRGLHAVPDFIRRFGFDEFVQIGLVSRDPGIPGTMSMVGHRPQTLDELDDMEWVLGMAGKSAQFNNWYEDIYSTKLPGVLGIESFLDQLHEPASLAYYEKRIELGTWYHEFGSPAVDVEIISNVISLGGISLNRYMNNHVSV